MTPAPHRRIRKKPAPALNPELGPEAIFADSTFRDRLNRFAGIPTPQATRFMQVLAACVREHLVHLARTHAPPPPPSRTSRHTDGTRDWNSITRHRRLHHRVYLPGLGCFMLVWRAERTVHWKKHPYTHQPKTSFQPGHWTLKFKVSESVKEFFRNALKTP